MGNRPQPFDLSGSPSPGAAGAAEDFGLTPRGPGAGPAGGTAHAGVGDAGTPGGGIDLPPLDLDTDAAGRPFVQPRAWPVYLAAFVVSALVLAAPVLYALGLYQSAFGGPAALLRADRLAVVAGFLLLEPVALVWLAAYLVQQGRRLAAEAERARALAASLLAPAALAARATGSTVQAVRLEIQRASEAAAEAHARLQTLREALATEGERLVAAAADSSRAAGALTADLAGERDKMQALTASLDASAAKIAGAITSHTRMMTEASDLAETQIREAEAALAARAADLAAAAGEAGDAARLAGDTLTAQVDRLEAAGASAGDQARAIEESLSEQRAALVTVAHGMRADHETYAVQTESLRAQLAEIVGRVHEGAAELGATATQSAEILRQMIAAAGEQLRRTAQTAGEERDRLSAQAAQSLAAVSELAARQREAMEAGARDTAETLAAGAEQARAAADAHVEAARGQLAKLGEMSVAAKDAADGVFQARLAEARQIIEQAAHLVDEAGAQTADRLKGGVESARGALSALEAVLVEVDQRLARAPADAEARATAIRQNVERGIEALMDSARSAAEETRNIDAAFQDRVRRNYDMLSEAVRLMGVVAGAGATAGSQRVAARPPSPPAPPPAQASAPATLQTPNPAQAPAAAAPPQAPAPPQDPSPPGDAQGLRPRLKLTPTATDEEFKTVFAAAGGREQAESVGDSWTWKELLSSMDKPVSDEGSLTAVVIGEVEAMGIDAGALVPRARIEEIAAVVKAGETARGRDMVRRLAPAAVRRLSRRMMADRNFDDQARGYVRRYAGMIGEAAKREGDRFSASAMLGSDQGRTYLLLDAAIMDAG